MSGMSSEPRRTVLVVDDDDVFRERLLKAFVARGYDARGAKSAEEAVSLAEEETPEWALLDLHMGKTSGLYAVRRLLELDKTTRIVVLTGYGSIATAIEAMRSGAVHYLTKPSDLDDIIAAFEHDGSPAARLPTTTVPSLHRVEWEHIERVLVACGGNITQAANLLGIHRRSLQRKLSKRPGVR